MSSISRSTPMTLITFAIAPCIGLCALFWIGEPSWNRQVFGRYSVKWFAGAAGANAMIIAGTFACLTRLRRRRGPTGFGIRRPTMLKEAIFAGVTVLPFLVGFELLLRAHYFPSPPRALRGEGGSAMEFHSLLQHVDRVMLDGMMVRSYRGVTYELRKTVAFRILCLGGSTTWGHHLEREQTWPAMLEGSLRDLGYDVEVINAGRPWYTSAHSVVNYAVHMRYYEPDIVIIMHGVNDLTRSFPAPGEPPPEWDYGSYQGPMRNVLAGYRAYNRNSDWAAWMPARVVKSLAIYRILFERESMRVNRSDAEVGLDAFPTLASLRAHLEYLARLCLYDRHMVVFATQAHVYGREDGPSPPDFAQTVRAAYMQTANGSAVSPRSLQRTMRAVREATLDVAKSLDIAVADVERTIDAESEYFMDDFHLNAEGNALAAQTLLSVVAPMLDELGGSLGQAGTRPASLGERG